MQKIKTFFLNQNTFVFGAAIFFGAFLMFAVELMISKKILPWFGGSPSVWTLSMLFFQVFLLLGYVYAHLLVKYFTPKRQAIIHIILLALSLVFIPVLPKDFWKPDSVLRPGLDIILLLIANLGLPFFILSATGPLLQVWYAKIKPEKSPYKLYALSNAGSLIGLLIYPFFVEPLAGLKMQDILWAVLYFLFVVFCVFGAFYFYKNLKQNTLSLTADKITKSEKKPTKANYLLWILLPTTASILLLAATNLMTQDIAVIPFLWVAPLSLYLLSFIFYFFF